MKERWLSTSGSTGWLNHGCVSKGAVTSKPASCANFRSCRRIASIRTRTIVIGDTANSTLIAEEGRLAITHQTDTDSNVQGRRMSVEYDWPRNLLVGRAHISGDIK